MLAAPEGSWRKVPLKFIFQLHRNRERQSHSSPKLVQKLIQNAIIPLRSRPLYFTPRSHHLRYCPIGITCMATTRTNAFGKWLKSRRLALDLTQEALAARVGIAAVSYHKIETGTRRPSRHVAELLGNALEIFPHERDAFVRFARDGHAFDFSPFSAPNTPTPRETVLYPHAHHLPPSLSLLLGREREIKLLHTLLKKKRTRLVTLTGMGGIGKTRLATQLAADLSAQFPDDAWFVDLSALKDASFVPLTIVRALNLRESSQQTALERVTAFLRDKQLLLVLDNFEQVMDAAPFVETLLKKCRGIKILVTSRAPLHLSKETIFPVPPLDVPQHNYAQASSVALFVQHARFAKPDFQSQPETIAEICRTLEGIPLALELAAARAKILPIKQIAQLLEQRFKLLRGKMDAPERHQTLWNALAWSYDLLTELERAVFRRLAVFAGGCALEAAERVCAAETIRAEDVLDLLASLADKSLLRIHVENDAARFQMLDTVHEFARAKLEEANEADASAARHAAWMLAFAVHAEAQLTGAAQCEWLDLLELENNNARVAFDWCLARGEIETGLSLAGALWRFWIIRGYWREARTRVTQLLAASASDAPTPSRNKVLHVAGYLAWVLDDGAAARNLYDECLRSSEMIHDEHNAAYAQRGLGLLAYSRGENERAQNYFDAALARFRVLDDALGITFTLDGLGELARVQERFADAETIYRENLALARRLDFRTSIAVQLHNLGHVVLVQGDAPQATAYLREALQLDDLLGDKRKVAEDVAGLACCFAGQRDYKGATKLFAWADHNLQKLEARLDPTDARDVERYTALARRELGEKKFRDLWQEGVCWTFEASKLALEKFDAD